MKRYLIALLFCLGGFCLGGFPVWAQIPKYQDLLAGNNTWPGIHNAIPLTDLNGILGASTACSGTVTPRSSFGFYQINVTGTGCVIAMPTSILAGDFATFLINEGSGSNLATFASGYDGWIGGASFTGTASAVNYVTCQFTGTTPATVCGPGGTQAGLVAPVAGSFSLRSNHVVSAGLSSGTSETLGYSGGTAGDLGVIKVFWFTGSTVLPTSVVAGADTYALVSNTHVSSFYDVAIYSKVGMTVTSGTITVSFAGTENGIFIFFEEWNLNGGSAVEAGIGNADNGGGASTNTSLTLTTNGFVTQTGELITSGAMACCSDNIAGGNTVIDTAGGFGEALASEYKLTAGSSGTDTNTYTMSSQYASGAVAGFTH